jgi:hypothetical protein
MGNVKVTKGVVMYTLSCILGGALGSTWAFIFIKLLLCISEKFPGDGKTVCFGLYEFYEYIPLIVFLGMWSGFIGVLPILLEKKYEEARPLPIDSLYAD